MQRIKTYIYIYIERERERERKREREERHKAIIQVPSTNRKSCPPCTSKESSLKCNIWLELFTTTTSKRLQTSQVQLQEISYAQEHNQDTSYAQPQVQETSIQTELQRNLVEVEHLIYN